jgi:hypothetical protein
MNRASLRIVFLLPAVIGCFIAIGMFGEHADWPRPAQVYLDWYTREPLLGTDLLFNRVALVGVLGLVLSTVGLLFYWSPARYAYLLSLVLSLFGEAPGVPVIAGGVVHLLDVVANIGAGAVIALVFFGPASHYFHKADGET